MTLREKRLAALVAGILLVLAGWSAWGKVGAAFDAREQRLTALRREVRRKENLVEQSRQAALRRDDYRRRSLPADREVAQFEYRRWLRQLIDKAGWREVDLRPQQSPARRGIFERLGYSITAQGTLESLVTFLYGYYQSDHLQQIRRIDVQPAEEPGELKLFLQLEALSLNDAKRQNGLSTANRVSEKRAPLADYVKSIAGRNLFAAYVPPPPPRPKVTTVVQKPTPPLRPKPAFDEAKYAYVTGILQDAAGEPQVWLQVRTTGETLKLKAGEPFRLGTASGSVVRIEARQVVISLGEEHLLISLGESVRDGVSLPLEGL